MHVYGTIAVENWGRRRCAHGVIASECDEVNHLMFEDLTGKCEKVFWEFAVMVKRETSFAINGEKLFEL